MTMLDRMRRHKGWLKWSLALVVLTFVVFYIPDFLGPDPSMVPTGDRLATIDSQAISVADFRRRYMAQVQAYRSLVRWEGDRRNPAADAGAAAGAAADDPGEGRADRGRAGGHQRERCRSARADHGHSRAAGKRAVHRRTALSPAAGAADTADHTGRFRGVGARRADARQVPGRPHRMDDGVGCRSRSASTSGATRKSPSTSSRCSPTTSRRR